MAAYKVVFQFSTSGGATFTEVFYRDAATIADASKFDPTFFDGRVKMLHSLNRIDFARVSALDASRQTAVVPVGRFGEDSETEKEEGDASAHVYGIAPGAAVVAVLGGVNGGTRRYWIRGIAHGDYAKDPNTGRDLFNALFITGFRTWIATLANANFGIRLLGKANPATNPLKKIVKVDGTRNDGTADVTCDGALALDATQRAIITKASPKDLPGLNGHWSIVKLAPPVYTIAYRTPGNALVQLTNSGYMHAELYGAISIFDKLKCNPDHHGTRTTRNPSTHSRGARRAQRLRQLA